MSRDIHILFTSAGRRVELLTAFRRAAKGLGLGLSIVATDIDPLAAAFHVADETYIVPRSSDSGFVPALTEICEREHVQLVFPLTDTDIPILANQKGVLESTGARVVVVSPRYAEITRDKWKTYLLFREHGIPVPTSWLPADPALLTCPLPVVVKPRAGSGGRLVNVAHTRQQLSFFKSCVPTAIVQEYVRGPEITTDVVSDFDGNVLGAVCRQRIEIRAGEVSKGKTVRHEAALSYCVKLAEMIGAVGPITVQCLLQDGEPRFTEVNARFGGGAPLGFAAGIDSPRWLLALAAGIPFDVPPVGTYTESLYLTRCDRSFFLTEDAFGS